MAKATPQVWDFSADTLDIMDHLQWSYRNHKGYAFIGLYNQATDKMTQRAFLWPTEKQELAEFLTKHASVEWVEVFYCPLLRQTTNRSIGNATHHDLIWADADKGLAQNVRDKLESWGARIVATGSPGAFHVYLRLDQDLNADQHRNCEEALRAFLNADNKIADNDFLKVPGSWNYKNHPRVKPERRIPKAVLSKVEVWGSVVTEVFEKLSVSKARIPHTGHEKDHGWDGVVREIRKIPDNIRAFLDEKSEGEGSGRFRRAYHAVRAVAEATKPDGSQQFTLEDCHSILDRYDPGVDKFNDRPGGWHGQITKIWEDWEAERSLLTMEDAAEEKFWSSREGLQHIYVSAHCAQVSPWAVLGVVLTRVVHKIPWYVQLPSVKVKSLNLYVGLIGESGEGKGSAVRVAEECVDVGPVTDLELGTGQGMVSAFMDFIPEKKGIDWVRRAAWFDTREIGVWKAHITNQTDPMLGWLVSMWSGEGVGAKYKSREKDIRLPQDSYRMSLVMGVQPPLAGPLLDNVDNGTPQRFLWFPAHGLSGEEKELPPPLIWPSPEWPVDEGEIYSIPFPDSVKSEVSTWIKERRNRREMGLYNDRYASHEKLVKSKVAAILMAYDGRVELSEEDWQLAEYVVQVSNARRTEVIRELQRVEDGKTKSAAKKSGVLSAYSDKARKDAEKEIDNDRRKNAVRVAKVMLGKLENEMTLGRFRNLPTSRDRQFVDDAIALMKDKNRIRIVVRKGVQWVVKNAKH
jgi:hypothetical protein